jgi:fructokinase
MSGSRIIVGIGEALFDVFPDEQRLGGAPLNVAVHAQQLGNAGVVVSRVGQDPLGQRVADALREREMSTEHLQTDPDNPTGTVYVDVSESGSPSYEIVEGVAWDFLQWDGDLDDLSDHAGAVSFGTLAQRNAQARNTIYRFLEQSHRAVRLFDVNLRQDLYDRRKIRRSLELANAMKLNADELTVVADLLNLGQDLDAAIGGLFKQYDLKWIALTRGKEGTVVYTAEARYESAPVVAAGGGDAVGAGDATSAALLHGALRRWPWERTLRLANTLGAHVAGQSGACPELTDTIRKLAD